MSALFPHCINKMSCDSEKVFIFWSKSSGKYATLSSLLSRDGWQVLLTARSQSLAQFPADERRLVCLAILNPIGRFTPDDVRAIERFVLNGHKAILANSASDQESARLSNINDLAKLFGVTFNEDRVIRPNPYKLYHPTEAVLEDFIVNRGLSDSLAKVIGKKSRSLSDDLVGEIARADESSSGAGGRIVYPRGCTMKILSRSATVMMTSSKWALPSCQPICAFYRDDKNSARLIALGSASLLSDKFIDKEDNRSLIFSLLEFITKDDFKINVSDARTLEIAENNMTADMDKLIDTPISCFQSLEPLPENRLSLIDKSLFNIDNSKLPTLLRAYKELNVAGKPLTLMRPKSISWLRDISKKHQARQYKFILRRADGKIEMV